MTKNFWHQVGAEYIKRIAPIFKQLFEQFKKTDRTKMTKNFWHQVGEEYIKRIAPIFKQLFEQSNGYPSGLKTGTVQLQVFCPSRLPKTQT